MHPGQRCERRHGRVRMPLKLFESEGAVSLLTARLVWRTQLAARIVLELGFMSGE